MAGHPQIIRAVDLVIYINGTIFGVATGVSWDASTGSQARYGIDQQHPFEIMSTQVSIKGNVQCLRKHNDAGVEGAGIVPVEHELSKARYFFLQLVDRLTDTVVLQIPKAAMISQQWQAQARGSLSGSFSFEGVQWSNEF